MLAGLRKTRTPIPVSFSFEIRQIKRQRSLTKKVRTVSYISRVFKIEIVTNVNQRSSLAL